MKGAKDPKHRARMWACFLCVTGLTASVVMLLPTLFVAHHREQAEEAKSQIPAPAVPQDDVKPTGKGPTSPVITIQIKRIESTSPVPNRIDDPPVPTPPAAQPVVRETTHRADRTQSSPTIAYRRDPSVREEILGRVDRPYVSNPYTPDIATSGDLSRILVWGNTVSLDNAVLRIPPDPSGRVFLSQWAFSPADNRVAFAVSADGKCRLYGDAKQLANTEPVEDFAGLQFSRDGRRLVYAGKDVDGRWWVFVNGQRRFGPFPQAPLPCVGPKEDEVFYAVEDAGVWRLFRNNQSIYGPFLKVAWIDVSISGRIAFAAEKPTGTFLTIDENTEGPYDHIWGYSFDPSGKRYAYVGRIGASHRIMVDGKEQGTFDDVAITPRFSPQGKSVAFATKQEKATETAKSERLPDGTITLSMDLSPRKVSVFINGKNRLTRGYSNIDRLGAPRYGIHELCVNDLGTQFAYAEVSGAEGGGGYTVKVSDGSVAWPCSDFVRNGEPRFVADDTVQFVALKHGGEGSRRPIYRVQLKLAMD